MGPTFACTDSSSRVHVAAWAHSCLYLSYATSVPCAGTSGAEDRPQHEGTARASIQRKESEHPGTISGLYCVFLIRKITTLLTFLFQSCSVLGNGSYCNKQHCSPDSKLMTVDGKYFVS